MDLLRDAWAFAFNSRSKFPSWIIPPLLLADALLSTAVVLKIPCALLTKTSITAHG
jgi:alpha-1,3-mannosyltransferase